MNIIALIYIFCLFYVFIPGNFIELPFKTNNMVTLMIHALLFSIILTTTYDLVNALNILGV